MHTRLETRWRHPLRRASQVATGILVMALLLSSPVGAEEYELPSPLRLEHVLAYGRARRQEIVAARFRRAFPGLRRAELRAPLLGSGGFHERPPPCGRRRIGVHAARVTSHPMDSEALSNRNSPALGLRACRWPWTHSGDDSRVEQARAPRGTMTIAPKRDADRHQRAAMERTS
jgi:hypothetical protein